MTPREPVPLVLPECEANLRPRYAIESAAWIWHPSKHGHAPAVLVFENRFRVARREEVRLHVSADQRYELFLDGELLSRGPDRGDVEHWSFATYRLDLAPGEHVLEATAWWIGGAAPVAQVTHRGGFILAAEGDLGAALDTGRGRWRVADRTDAWSFEDRPGERPAHFVGAHQTVHGDRWFAPREWVAPQTVVGPLERAEWYSVRPGWALRPSGLPDQVSETRRTGRIVALIPGGLDAETPLRSDHLEQPGIAAWQAMLAGGGAVTVPPRTTLSVLWDLGDYTCGHSQAMLSGGAGSELSMTWAEALFEHPLSRASKHKGNRRQWVGKYCRGPRDSFRNDGGQKRSYTACWWRSGCLVLVTVRTEAEPLVVDALSFRETRYPLEPEAVFACDRPEVERVVPFCVRGLQMCAHETYMDCPHYEQILYAGDTRLHNLIGYTLTADDRLARRCIELLDWSRRYFGFTNSAYPSGGPQLISSFPLYWVLMVRDHAWWRDDAAFVRARLPGVRANLDAFAALCGPDGLACNAPGWAFIDTVPEWAGTLYAPKSTRGPSSTFNLLHALALRSAAELEEWAEEPELAARWRRRAEGIVRAVAVACWDGNRALMADYPDRSAWSQHAQIMGLLTGAVPTGSETACLGAMLGTSGLAQAQPMFWMFHLFEAFQHLGRGDLVLDHLLHWTGLMDDLGLCTPYEMYEPARSDCHAWGSHPLFHLHTTVAGVRPAAPGFRRVRIAPAPGSLARIRTRMPHPRGFIDTDLDFPGPGAVRGHVSLPEGITGEFRWGARSVELRSGRQTIAFASRETAAELRHGTALSAPGIARMNDRTGEEA